MNKTNGPAAVSGKTVVICLAVIFWAIGAANFWRLSPPDPDCVRAVSLYSGILEETSVIGLEYSSLTTTLGSFAVKKTSENPVTAALMVRLLKEAGAGSAAELQAVAINASGSFPGFVLAALSACSALDIQAYVIASVGSSAYGANMSGNTIADMLLKDRVRQLGFTLLAVTPGGSDDRGMELDEEELERISRMLDEQGVPFIRPAGLADAVALRESMFNEKGCRLLVNIGGGHASGGADTALALESGVLKPNGKKTYKEPGLIQKYLANGRSVIQILNVRKLYAAYGLDFDRNGKLSGGERLYRWKKLPLPAAGLPVTGLLVLLGILRYSRIDKRKV